MPYMDISDFEEVAADLKVGDSIFEELAIKRGKVPPCADLLDIELLKDKKVKRYIFGYKACPNIIEHNIRV